MQHRSQPSLLQLSSDTGAAADGAQSSALIFPEGTLVTIELAEAVSSATHRCGDRFRLRLAEPLVIDGQQLLAAGVPGTGKVVHAAAARGGGAAGELLLAARSLQCNAQTVALRSFNLGATGKDHSASAIGVATLGGPLGLFVRGGQIEIPPGTRGTGKIAVAIPRAICAIHVFPSTNPLA
ncbi:hypothetical protein [Xanthomonas bromi]|nr:hypothetical protein [Xanthomonas bromi]